jgi:methyltransferase (TIGR00027 family)
MGQPIRLGESMIVSQIKGQSISWQEDYANRINPSLMTSLLRDAIPVLRSVDWRVNEIDEGYCRSELPLCYASTNQHGTHQAALISLSADYTGGIALATLLRGIPFAGVHHCNEETSASLWLAAMDVRYRAPSTEHLYATCRVPEEMYAMIRHRYFAGKRVLVTLNVQFTNDSKEVVADAQMKYFVQPSIQLKPTKENPTMSPIFKHKLKASARMIAGIRASSESDMVRLDHAHERNAAGPHGELLARRLHGILPQLREVVVARTRHIDEILSHIPGLMQVVLLGVGLDMRPFRLAHDLNRPMFFELDLPEMLEERSRVIALIKDRPVVRRRMVVTDFKRDHVGELLLKHPDFDPRVPTAVIYEGCSMYFSKEENKEVLQAVAQVLEHPDSRLWCDMVKTSVVNGTTNVEEIAKFVAGMDQLGESFLFGCDAPAEFLAECGYSTTRVTLAQDFLGSPDSSLSTYQFAVSKV